MRPSPQGRPRAGADARPKWLLPVLGALAGLLLLWLAYDRGRAAAGVDGPALLRQKLELLQRLDTLQKENAKLGAQVTELEMERRVDREAYGQIERTLGDLQSQLSRQGDDLAFYKSIVSPEDGVQGLRLQRFEVDKGSRERQFQLKLTLIQAMRHESLVSGLANVIVHGVEADRPKRYSVGELLGRPRAQLPFSFRYFQTIEQDVTLPEGFDPYEVEVQVRSSKLRQPLRASYPWSVR